MKIISADRGQGKTTKLVEKSSKEWKHIVCKDKQRVDVIIKTAERLGLDIPYPITIRELQDRLCDYIMRDRKDENAKEG